MSRIVMTCVLVGGLATVAGASMVQFSVDGVPAGPGEVVEVTPSDVLMVAIYITPDEPIENFWVDLIATGPWDPLPDVVATPIPPWDPGYSFCEWLPDPGVLSIGSHLPPGEPAWPGPGAVAEFPVHIPDVPVSTILNLEFDYAEIGPGVADVMVPLVLHVPPPYPATLVDSEPEMDGTLPRVWCNAILLTFDVPFTLPPLGAPLEIVTLPDGPDVTDHFVYSIMPDGVTLCAEEVDPLPNQTWYRVVSAPDFEVVPFMLDVCTLWGDVDFSGRVTTADYGVVKAHMGEATGSPCQFEPWDLNCSGRVTTSDYAVIKDHMGDRKPPKPLPGTLVDSYPSADGTMPTECRTLLLEFNSAISLPAEGAPLSVVSLHDATDVSDGYSYSVLADGRTLCAEWNALMVNQHWYQITPTEGFDVEPFVLDVCTLLGDLNGNCIVEEDDGAGIPERIDQVREPCTPFPWDLNCSGRVTMVDYTLLVAHVWEQCPAKP